MLARDVDRRVERELGQRLDQQSRLDARAAAELDQGTCRSRPPADLTGAPPQDLGLRAREIVLGQLADLVEQGRAARVVQELRGDGARVRGQSVDDGAAELLAVGRLGNFQVEYRTVHRRSSA